MLEATFNLQGFSRSLKNGTIFSSDASILYLFSCAFIFFEEVSEGVISMQSTCTFAVDKSVLNCNLACTVAKAKQFSI